MLKCLKFKPILKNVGITLQGNKNFLSKVVIISTYTQTVLRAFPTHTAHLPNLFYYKSYIFTILSKIGKLQSSILKQI